MNSLKNELWEFNTIVLTKTLFIYNFKVVIDTYKWILICFNFMIGMNQSVTDSYNYRLKFNAIYTATYLGLEIT